jgi:hypothetical protein
MTNRIKRLRGSTSTNWPTEGSAPRGAPTQNDYAKAESSTGFLRGATSPAAPRSGYCLRPDRASSSTRRACSSPSSASQAETDRHPRYRATRAHLRAWSRLAWTVYEMTLSCAMAGKGGRGGQLPRPRGVNGGR